MIVLLALFVVAGLAFLPKHVHVERSVFVAMPASTVFTLLNGFTSFTAWSPWAAKDPQAQYTLSGPESGTGARLIWAGNRLVGGGALEITHSDPYDRIDIQLDFSDQGQAETRYAIVPSSGGVELTWSYETDVTHERNFYDALIGRYVGIMFDRWIGRDFEEGLANFKIFAERLPKTDFSGLEVEVLEVAAWDILYVSSQVEQDPERIAGALAAAYGEINAYMRANGLFPMTQPLAIPRFTGGSYSFDAAIPVNIPSGLQLTGNVKTGRSPEGYAVKTVHRGSYREMSEVYEKLGAYMAAHGYAQGDVSWEHYITEPTTTDEEQQITHIYYLINPPGP